MSDEKTISNSDLESIFSSLENAYSVILLLDLQRQFMSLRRAPEHSALTRQVKASIDTINDILNNSDTSDE